MLKSRISIIPITRIVPKKKSTRLLKKHISTSHIGFYKLGFNFRINSTRVSAGPKIMTDNGLDSTFLRILDNEDPFTDSETRDSKIVLSEDSHLHGSQKRIFSPHQGVVCSTPRLEKPKDVSPIKEDLLSSTFESSDIDDDFIAAMEAAESTCPQRTASTPKMRMNTRRYSRRDSTRSSSSGTPTQVTKKLKTCTYIQTASQGATPMMQESDTGVDIMKPNVGCSSPLTKSPSPPPPPSISQVRNPFRVPTQFQRFYSTTSVTDQKRGNMGQDSASHTIVLATQHLSKQLKPPDTQEKQQKQLQVDAKNVKPIILSHEQEYVLKQVLQGVSLFFTGPAGTGKSVLLRSIIKSLRSKRSRGIAVTASTGLAACNIGGITLHSFAGIGLGQGSVDSLYKKVRRNKTAFKRWQETKVLVIDEISMVDGNLLDKMNELAKKIRKSNAPFGGIQLVACGDFYQLPPVVKSHESESEEIHFAFECGAWSEAITQTITLKEVFRQKGDSTFINMLNEMRDGMINKESIVRFQQLERPLKCPEGFVPSELYATRYEVDNANRKKLAKIDAEEVIYKAKDSGTLPPKILEQMVSNFLAPQVLQLKVGAQVMLIKNINAQLVNGSLGKVVGFVDRATLSEGDSVFSEFMTTKQLSSSNGADERKRKHMSKMKDDSLFSKLPVVKFITMQGTTQTVIVDVESWSTEDVETESILAKRIQLPLNSSWSLSIHKSQGQSLSYVIVDFKKIFAAGQAYVALSRAVSRDGLQILNFNPNKIHAHPKVIKFYKSLSTV
ncbi:ATP-dependent DNA helicase PIF1 [Candida tropicalis]